VWLLGLVGRHFSLGSVSWFFVLGCYVVEFVELADVDLINDVEGGSKWREVKLTRWGLKRDRCCAS
jgi:hypothetical protein